jgi:hypothetical protein
MTVQNFKMSVNGDNNQMNTKVITFEIAVERIKHMGLETNVTVALIGKARTVPPGSLEHFVNNIQTHIANVVRETNEQKK